MGTNAAYPVPRFTLRYVREGDIFRTMESQARGCHTMDLESLQGEFVGNYDGPNK